MKNQKSKRIRQCVVLFSLLSLLLIGCQSKTDNKPQPSQDNTYYSSQDGLDYIFKVDDSWKVLKTEPYYHFTKDDMNLYVLKRDIDNQKYSMGTQSKIYPQLFIDYEFENIKFEQLKVESSQTDYIDELKFKYNIGRYNEHKYQAIYFLSENVVPSVSGKVVANCMLITYQDTSDTKVRDEINSLEKSIYYE